MPRRAQISKSEGRCPEDTDTRSTNLSYQIRESQVSTAPTGNRTRALWLGTINSNH